MPPKRENSTAILYGEYSFVLGVFNVVFTTFIMSKYPYNYWIWLCVKNFFLLVTRFKKFRSIGWHYYLLEFCYTVNYWTILYIVICLLKRHVSFLEFMGQYTDFLGYYLFRICFTWSMGPLALSIALFRNALVFHSADHMTILAVHIGPPLACYGMRWYADELEKANPNTFHIRVNESEESPSELLRTLLFIPTVMYIVLWTIPYSATIFYLRFKKIKESGYETMYNAYGTSLVRSLGYFGESFKPAVYMTIHGSLCFLSFILSQLLWRSFWLNTVYLLGLLLVSVWNGSTYYFEVFATKKDKAKAPPSSSDENKLQPAPIEESKLQ